jgi:hypothetical protein
VPQAEARRQRAGGSDYANDQTIVVTVDADDTIWVEDEEATSERTCGQIPRDSARTRGPRRPPTRKRVADSTRRL